MTDVAFLANLMPTKLITIRWIYVCGRISAYTATYNCK